MYFVYFYKYQVISALFFVNKQKYYILRKKFYGCSKNFYDARNFGVLRSCAELFEIFVKKLFQKFCVY